MNHFFLIFESRPDFEANSNAGAAGGGGFVKKPSARDYDELKNRYDEKYTGPLGAVSKYKKTKPSYPSALRVGLTS